MLGETCKIPPAAIQFNFIYRASIKTQVVSRRFTETESMTLEQHGSTNSGKEKLSGIRIKGGPLLPKGEPGKERKEEDDSTEREQKLGGRRGRPAGQPC